MKIQNVAPVANVEEPYRLLVESITDYAVYMLDHTGVIASWNPGAQRFKGYTTEEIIGSHFSLFYTEEDRLAGLPARGLEIAASQGRFETEGWRVRNDGSKFWAHVIIDPIRDAQGALTGFAKVTRDITDQYETRQKLDSAREALFQAQKMEAVGRLTGGVAHDFNNLLTIILVSLNLARKRAPDSPVIGLIENAIQGAERGAAMTQRMLAFSRHQPLQPEPLLISDLVEGMSGLLKQSVEPIAAIHLRFAADLPHILGDRNQLETTLLNLVFNARDAMPDGGDIIISARLPSDLESEKIGVMPGQFVLLEVADTGEGMDDDTLHKAVDPFFTTKGVGKGTGLGLSMAHGIVEQLGGKLKLHSSRGSGTVVQLWLPVTHEMAAAHTPTQTAQVDRVVKSLNILVIDDDELVLTNICTLLEDMGHSTHRASSAVRGVDLLKSGGIELVITDHALPGASGSQLADQLGRLYPALPVIITSGYAEIAERLNSSMATLAKPFDEASLSKAICQAIVRKPAAPSREEIS